MLTQYENDKAVRTAKIKNSIFAEGKIVLETSQGKVEYEKMGEWKYIRSCDVNNQLSEEIKKRINNDVYGDEDFYITEDYLTNLY